MSVQASCFSLLRLQATHTAEQHLKPDPNASCHTRSPFLTPWKVSTYDQAYLQHAISPRFSARAAHGCLMHDVQRAHACQSPSQSCADLSAW